METATPPLRQNYWNARGRWLIFFLAASSIACLLADFYRLCPMHIFTRFIFLPALLALFAFGALDRWRGDGQLWRAVSIGLVAGLLAAVAYDMFRLPFVFAKEWGIESVVPPMKLFNVFPRFGAMVLGQPIEQSEYSLTAQVVGRIYHFSNGATFGVMYLAIIGNASIMSDILFLDLRFYWILFARGKCCGFHSYIPVKLA